LDEQLRNFYGYRNNKRKIIVKLFIVEDSDLMIVRLTQACSEIPGIEIIGSADTAAEATESIRRLKPDLVVLDIRLKEGNGMTVLGEIKRGMDAPCVLVLTAYPDDQYRMICDHLGADHFFNKAIEFEEAMQVVRRLSEGKNEIRTGERKSEEESLTEV
jgi:DNA-binding NarL/FixJ family response regulator